MSEDSCPASLSYLLIPWKGTSLLKTVSTYKKYNYIYGVYKKGGFPWKETKPLKKNKERYKFDFYLNNCFLRGPPPPLK